METLDPLRVKIDIILDSDRRPAVFVGGCPSAAVSVGGVRSASVSVGVG
jgi:hypothetical protein